MTHRIQPMRFQVSRLCLLLLPWREEPLWASHSPFHPLRRKQALQVDVCRRVQLLCFAFHMFTPLYENLRFFMASALTARLLAQMVRTTMRTPTTNVTRGQRKQCRRTISSCVRCRSTSSGLWTVENRKGRGQQPCFSIEDSLQSGAQLTFWLKGNNHHWKWRRLWSR